MTSGTNSLERKTSAFMLKGSVRICGPKEFPTQNDCLAASRALEVFDREYKKNLAKYREDFPVATSNGLVGCCE